MVGQTQAGLISPVGFFTARKRRKKKKESNNEDQLAVEDYTTFALRGGLKSVRRTD